jgi:hypothetical protein
MVLCGTGLPSRSALVAPPLRLAALRWRVANVILGRFRPPPGVSTAFVVAVTRFSDTRFPRVPPLRMCPYQFGGTPAHSQGRHARRFANSRAPGCTRRGESAMWVARGPWERCQATAGRSPARRVARPFQRRLAPPRALRGTSGSGSGSISGSKQRRVPARPRNPATESGHGLRSRFRARTEALRVTWFSAPPACRHVRRSSRLRSGSPPCGGVRRSSYSCDPGHLRAARRPSWWLWRASPIRDSRGCPP